MRIAHMQRLGSATPPPPCLLPHYPTPPTPVRMPIHSSTLQLNSLIVLLYLQILPKEPKDTKKKKQNKNKYRKRRKILEQFLDGVKKNTVKLEKNYSKRNTIKATTLQKNTSRFSLICHVRRNFCSREAEQIAGNR